MLECGISDMKDDYELTDQINSENKQNERKKSKMDVSFYPNFNLKYSVYLKQCFLIFITFQTFFV